MSGGGSATHLSITSMYMMPKNGKSCRLTTGQLDTRTGYNNSEIGFLFQKNPKNNNVT
jgi:ABC-type lipoprotein export system ATPase subunit